MLVENNFSTPIIYIWVCEVCGRKKETTAKITEYFCNACGVRMKLSFVKETKTTKVWNWKLWADKYFNQLEKPDPIISKFQEIQHEHKTNK